VKVTEILVCTRLQNDVILYMNMVVMTTFDATKFN